MWKRKKTGVFQISYNKHYKLIGNEKVTKNQLSGMKNLFLLEMTQKINENWSN